MIALNMSHKDFNSLFVLNPVLRDELYIYHWFRYEPYWAIRIQLFGNPITVTQQYK